MGRNTSSPKTPGWEAILSRRVTLIAHYDGNNKTSRIVAFFLKKKILASLGVWNFSETVYCFFIVVYLANHVSLAFFAQKSHYLDRL